MTNRAIWKYPLAMQPEQEISMPGGANILCVQTQKGVPNLWALVTVDAPERKRMILIYATGQLIIPIPHKKKRIYISTFQMLDGSLVWHVFEIV